MITETIHWIPTNESLPDCDLTVLIFCPDSISGSDPVWLGFFDGEVWRDVSAGHIEETITHWSNIPNGPTI